MIVKKKRTRLGWGVLVLLTSTTFLGSCVWALAKRQALSRESQQLPMLLTQVSNDPTLLPLLAGIQEKATLLAPTAAADTGPSAPKNGRTIALPTVVAPGVLQAPIFVTGIFADDPGPFYSGDFTMENRWQGERNGQFVQVYAGTTPAQPEQGLVIVLVTNFNYQSEPAQWLNPPTATGSLHVVSQIGDQLLLESTTGKQWILNLNTLEWQ
jgi:hypothetical protein